MRPVKLFGYLCLGYAGIWITLLTSIGLGLIENEKHFFDVLIYSLFLSLICLYPAFAIGFIFNQQTKLLRWKAVSLFSALIAALISSWMMWDYVDGGFMENAGLIYSFVGILVGTFLGAIFASIGCIAKHQKSITRWLGGTALSGISLLVTLYILAISNIINYGIFGLGLNVPYLATIVIAFAGLISSVFLGPRVKENNT